MTLQDLSGQTFGQYELRELLGVGGMGAVYRGLQTSLQRAVAIKVLSTQLAAEPGYLERFYREAKTAAALEHAHIVAVYDYGIQRDISYVVMRLLTGGALSERMQRRIDTNQPLPTAAEVAGLLRQVASALDYAHSQNVIHRDIKPSNIMFDNQGNAYLVDFGIAKLLGSTSGLTGTGMVMGTPTYMPPEQWRSEELTPAADQYALGITVYSLLAGRVPYEATTPFGLMHKHLNETPPPVHVQRPGLSEDVTTVLERALAKNPKDRFPTVTALAQAFERSVSSVSGESTGFFTMSMPQRKPAIQPTMATMPEAIDEEGTTVGEAAPPVRPATPTPRSKTKTAPSAPTKEGKPSAVPPADHSMPVKIPSGTARSRRWWWGVGAVALLIVAAIIFALMSGSDEEKPAAGTSTSAADVEASPTPPAATATTAPLIAVLPSDTPETTATSAPTDTPEPTDTREPTATLEPSATPTLEPSNTPTLEPTATPRPTNTPKPSLTPSPEPTEPPPTDTPPPPPDVEVKEVPPGSVIVVGVIGTTIRTRPSASAQVIGTIANDKLPLTGMTPDETWYRVDYQGQPGWIRRSAGVEVVMPAPPPLATLIVGVTGARLRSDPNDDAAVLGRVSNTRLPIIGRTGDNRWYLVEYTGQPAWVRQSAGVRVEGDLDAVQVIETPPPPLATLIVGVTGARLRSGPDDGAEVIGTVSNIRLPIIGRTGNNRWYMVEYAGQPAWVRQSAGVRVEGDLDAVQVIEPGPSVFLIVGVTGARLREDPTDDAQVLGTIANERLPIIGRTEDNRWYLVFYSEREYWIRQSAGVRVEGDLDTVPVKE